MKEITILGVDDMVSQLFGLKAMVVNLNRRNTFPRYQFKFIGVQHQEGMSEDDLVDAVLTQLRGAINPVIFMDKRLRSGVYGPAVVVNLQSKLWRHVPIVGYTSEILGPEEQSLWNQTVVGFCPKPVTVSDEQQAAETGWKTVVGTALVQSTRETARIVAKEAFLESAREERPAPTRQVSSLSVGCSSPVMLKRWHTEPTDQFEFDVSTPRELSFWAKF